MRHFLLLFLILNLASRPAMADAVFGKDLLEAVKYQLEDDRCLAGCESKSWVISCSPIPESVRSWYGPDAALFLVECNLPTCCGSAGCPTAWILRDSTRFVVISSSLGPTSFTINDFVQQGKPTYKPQARREGISEKYIADDFQYANQLFSKDAYLSLLGKPHNNQAAGRDPYEPYTKRYKFSDLMMVMHSGGTCGFYIDLQFFEPVRLSQALRLSRIITRGELLRTSAVAISDQEIVYKESGDLGGGIRIALTKDQKDMVTNIKYTVSTP